MHPEVREFVSQAVGKFGPFKSVVDFGGRDVNGSVRDLFGDFYLSVDLRPGKNVDVVTDVRVWVTQERFDCVVCTNVLEHVFDWQSIVQKAAEVSEPGGVFIVTTVSDPFPVHSGIDGKALQHQEHYGGVPRQELRQALEEAGFTIELETDDDSWEVQFVGRRVEPVLPEYGYQMCGKCGEAWKPETSDLVCPACGTRMVVGSGQS